MSNICGLMKLTILPKLGISPTLLPVHNENARAAFAPRNRCCHGHIVEEAEAFGAMCFSVVSRRPHNGSPVAALPA